jgi:hypothetical protein
VIINRRDQCFYRMDQAAEGSRPFGGEEEVDFLYEFFLMHQHPRQKEMRGKSGCSGKVALTTTHKNLRTHARHYSDNDLFCTAAQYRWLEAIEAHSG